MGVVTFNGKQYVGNNISIKNSKIIVDGVEVLSPSEKIINIEIVGNVEHISVDVCETIKVHGDVNDIISTSGDVIVTGKVGDISTTSGDVRCGDVSGSVVTTSGDVECDKLFGNATTISGDIKRH